MAASSAPPSDPTAAVTVPWPQVERFVGLFTHDIRNGLNALELQLTFLGEISEDIEAKAEVKRMRGAVADITRLLQTVRSSTGAPNPSRFAYPAADFVEDVRDRFDRQQADATSRVQWEVEPGAGSVEVDPELLMTALLKLLGNALFYAAKGSAVRVHVTGDAAAMTLSIHQTLASPPDGSPAEWGRTPLSSSRRNGYGLGVFRARRVIESQGGTLHFSYSEPEQSLVTSIALPASGPADPA